MEGVGTADIEVAAARRDLGVVLRGKAQMQLDLAPAHKAIFRVCFAQRAVGLHLETELPVRASAAVTSRTGKIGATRSILSFTGTFLPFFPSAAREYPALV